MDGKDHDKKGENIMVTTIDYCFRNNKVVSFYFDKEDNQVHLTGLIQCYNENEILISHISPRGEYDGFILKKIDDLYRIDYDGEYEKKIQQLYELKNQSHSVIKCSEDGILYPLLNFADDNNYMMSFELQNDKITGLINEYNDFIYVSTINDNGFNSGITVIDIDEVITFSCDTDYEQDLSFLYRERKQ
ncbi:MAG: hypothetical protein RRZ68_06940 [Oscillospiraceae bacterium]